MKKTDILIIGAGTATRVIHGETFALPGQPEDYFRNLLNVLSGLVAEADQVKQSPTGICIATPQFTGPHSVIINDNEWQAKKIVIASGCEPLVPKEFEDKEVLLPLEALRKPPKTAQVIGAGPLGVAIAATLAQKGCRVTLLSRHERILRNEDAEISQSVREWLVSIDVEIQTTKTFSSVKNGVLAVGLLPTTNGMNLFKAGVCLNAQQHICVDESMRTSNPNIFAFGAVTGPKLNLGIEDMEAEIVAENISAPFFSQRRIMPEPMPYTLPLSLPFARIGLTEAEGRTKFKDIATSTVPLGSGVIKLVGRKRTAELLGAHLFGPGADMMILYFDLLMRAGIPLREVNESQHYPSPSGAEAVGAAVKAFLKAN